MRVLRSIHKLEDGTRVIVHSPSGNPLAWSSPNTPAHKIKVGSDPVETVSLDELNDLLTGARYIRGRWISVPN